MGGKSSSSSAQTTQNFDNRIAVQDGVGVGAGGSFFAQDNSTSTTIVNTLDGGAIKDAFSFAGASNRDALSFAGNANRDALSFGSRALETVELSNAAVGEGFTQLLDAAEGLFNRGESLIGQTQAAVADAYGQAQNDKAGTIDNRTIIVLAVAGVGALWLMNRSK